jgi:hypothetical protein
MSDNDESNENLSLGTDEELEDKDEEEDLNLSVNMTTKPIETYREEMRKTNERLISNVFLNSSKPLTSDRSNNNTTINNFNININIEKKEPVRPMISPRVNTNMFKRGETQPIKVSEVKSDIRAQRFDDDNSEQDRQPRRASFHLRKKVEDNTNRPDKLDTERTPSQRHSGMHLRRDREPENEDISTKIKNTIIQKIVGDEEEEVEHNNIIRLNVQKEEESDVEDDELFDTIDDFDEEEVEYDQDFVKDVLLECNRKFIKDKITTDEKTKQMASRIVIIVNIDVQYRLG